MRAGAVVLALLAAFVLVARATSQALPLADWLVWRYLIYASLTVAWALSCVSAGRLVLARVLGPVLPARERWLFAFGAGVLIFGTGVELGGLLGWLGRPFFVAWPVVMGAPGAPALLREARRFVRAAASRGPRPSPGDVAAGAAIVVGLLLIYAKVAVPAHAGYDARWYHLPMAEHYAAAGAVRPFAEGWILGAYPQLMTLLYTWAFLLPGGLLFDAVELAAHLELAVFLGALMTVAFVARRLSGARGGALTSMALLFAFPAVFVYGPQCESDMLAAFWGGLAALAALRAWRRPSRPHAVLVGGAMAGLLMTKYAALAVLVPTALLVAVREIRSLRPSDGAPIDGPRARAGASAHRLALVAAVFLAGSSPHWAKNWVFYGDPLFPTLAAHLPDHPMTLQARDILAHFWPHEVWRPPATWAGVQEAALASVTFAFSPHEYFGVGHGWPLFGFLFTAALLVLPLVVPFRAAARETTHASNVETWLSALAVTFGIFVWYWIHHQDRYLQALLPWMAATAFAVFRRAWQQGATARALVIALCAWQAAWGADVWFHHTPVEALSALGRSGRDGSRREQLDPFRPMASVGRALPPESKVLLHEIHDHLGIAAPAVSDYAGWQTGISYVEAGGGAGVHRLLAGLGVTHLLWPTGQSAGMSSLGADLAFFSYALRFGRDRRSIGPFTLARIADHEPTADEAPPFAGVIGCGDGYASGIYRLPRLAVRAVEPPPAAEYPAPDLAAGADGRLPDQPLAGMAIDRRCQAGLPAPEGFELAATRGTVEIWVRR